MHSQPKQGFVLSLLLHLAVVATVFVFTFFKPLEKPPKTVFELVSAQPSSADVTPSDASVEFNVPVVRQPPRPKPPEPKPPEPTPEPPPPKPQPVVTPKPAPKPPEPKPKPPPTLSYEEFVKQHGAPTAPTPQKTAPKPVVVPRINTNFSANVRETVIHLDRFAQLSDAEQSALDRYIARLKEALRRAWDKPTSLAESLTATVEFDVAANGRLTGMRITRGSGNSQFDQSVLGAFNRLGSAGATPDGRAQQLRLTFRMTDM